MMMKWLVVLIASVAFVSSAEAQGIYRLTAPIQPTCKIGWVHDMKDSAGAPLTEPFEWSLILNGVRSVVTNVTQGAPAADGSVNFTVPCPAFVIGNTILVVISKTSGGDSGPSPEIQVVLSPPPPVKLPPGPASNVQVSQ